MNIPVSRVVNVPVTIGTSFPARTGFGTLAIITAENNGTLSTTNRTAFYSNIDEVADDNWPLTSEAYIAASSYFSQLPRPTSLKIAFRDSGESVTEALSAIQDLDNDWYGFMFTKEIRDLVLINTTGTTSVEDAAIWANARTKIFFNTTNDVNVLSSDAALPDTILDILTVSGYRRTISTYSSNVDQYPSASLAGRAFTVDFSQTDATITLMFKDLPGIQTEAISSNQLTNLEAVNGNVFTTVGTENMYTDSKMSDGVSFLDEVHGVDWFRDAIQIQAFGYLRSQGKVKQINKGYAKIEQQVRIVCVEAVNNGLVAPGFTIDDEYLPLGYKVDLVDEQDVNDSDIAARQYNGTTVTALGAGAIHGLQINLVFE